MNVFNKPAAAHCGDPVAIAWHQQVKPAAWDALSYQVVAWKAACRHCGWEGPGRTNRDEASADLRTRRYAPEGDHAMNKQRMGTGQQVAALYSRKTKHDSRPKRERTRAAAKWAAMKEHA